ncbi:MAG TPA: hypothetical protein ENH72_04490 [Pseudomonas sabulinigri]|uniref:ParE-like toxin domain-containing protein n=1 Tax=marine sediment metagenome TaxID=412755 RepID=A0A0F9VDT9_9ZZZZ|nr:hypothetical protein [Halopseudomonas sabulinigri]HEC51131.1 hypothetical protein [Halopseudomonas sabulinigri]
MITIDQVIATCPHQIMSCHQSKAQEIDKALQAGIPYTALGGKRMRCSKNLLRFKLGLSLRLIYRITERGHIPSVVITRQRLERELKRRRA